MNNADIITQMTEDHATVIEYNKIGSRVFAYCVEYANDQSTEFK